MAITSMSALVFSNISALFWMEVNSLDFAIKAALSQKFKSNGKWHLVVLFSKSLSLIKHNYEIHNKKILAII